MAGRGDALDAAVAAQFSLDAVQGGNFDEEWDALQYRTTSPQRKRHETRLSFRKPPETRNGVQPYLDIMTISSSQYPTVLSDKAQQSLHTKLFVEPISVPQMKHTGLKSQLTHKDDIQPLYYPNGTKRKNIRKQIQQTLRAQLYGDDDVGKKSRRRKKRAAVKRAAAQKAAVDPAVKAEIVRVDKALAIVEARVREDPGNPDLRADAAALRKKAADLAKVANPQQAARSGWRAEMLGGGAGDRVAPTLKELTLPPKEPETVSMQPKRAASSRSTQSAQPISSWYANFCKQKAARQKEVKSILTQLRGIGSRNDPGSCY